MKNDEKLMKSNENGIDSVERWVAKRLTKIQYIHIYILMAVSRFYRARLHQRLKELMFESNVLMCLQSEVYKKNVSMSVPPSEYLAREIWIPRETWNELAK